MVSIPEQARQNPRNATPFGFDVSDVVYPAVNTCATVTLFGARGLAGLHLGLFMGAGEEGGKGSGDSKMIDQAYLDMYLHVLKLQAYNKASTLMAVKAFNGMQVERKTLAGVYLAGALEVWQSSSGAMWTRLNQFATGVAAENNLKVKYFQFDDRSSMTVDIHVNRAGVRFTKPTSVEAVPNFPFNP